ncbi:MAG: hypothetical protein M3Q70_02125 [bacterium]|nr:hypothetical protein [bacterium]
MPETNPAQKTKTSAGLFDRLVEIMPGENELPQEFRAASRHVREKAAGFIGSLRLSSDPTRYSLGVARQALNQIRDYRNPHESRIYREWIQAGTTEAVARLTIAQQLSPKEIEDLAAENDPALIVICGIERVRINIFPDLHVISSSKSSGNDRHYESSDYGKLSAGYEAMIASIHGGLRESPSLSKEGPKIDKVSGF